MKVNNIRNSLHLGNPKPLKNTGTGLTKHLGRSTSQSLLFSQNPLKIPVVSVDSIIAKQNEDLTTASIAFVGPAITTAAVAVSSWFLSVTSTWPAFFQPVVNAIVQAMNALYGVIAPIL